MIPDAVINSFGQTLGVEVAGSVEMHVDDKKKLKGFDAIQAKVKALIREGYSAAQLLSQVCVETVPTFVTITHDTTASRSSYSPPDTDRKAESKMCISYGRSR